ncbi:MAG TPA: MBL fold metallo-hydrolase [Gammaproteobacteria bacterium]|nr:MBL fold metallo-hydrolase [Gammaproteobacteria bacterium]
MLMFLVNRAAYMYRFVLLLCGLLVSVGVLAGQELPDYPIQKLSRHVYVIHGPVGLPNPKNQGFMNNPVVVITAAGVVVIDPGSSLYSGRMVLRQLRSISSKPVTHVFNSHIHGDHWLGNQAIRDAYPKVKIYAHPRMIEEAKAGGGDSWVKIMERVTRGATAGTRPVYPTHALKDGQLIKVGGISFRVYLGKHQHTMTDAMIEVVEDSVMVTGDNALYTRIGSMDDGSFRGNIAALDLAIKLNSKVYIPGHGPSGDASVIKPYKTYLETVYNMASRLSEDGLADYEMKGKIAAKLKAYWDWAGFEIEFGRHISLAVLEYEQAGF